MNIDKYPHPVLYAHPQYFSPLSQSAVRGMKDTVKSILRNSRKQAHNKNKHKNRNKLIGDHHIIVDEGYKSQPPTDVTITPLQIASSEFIGSRQQKYLIIVEALVSYGANIHAATFFVNEIDPEDVARLNDLANQRQTMNTLLAKMRIKIAFPNPPIIIFHVKVSFSFMLLILYKIP